MKAVPSAGKAARPNQDTDRLSKQGPLCDWLMHAEQAHCTGCEAKSRSQCKLTKQTIIHIDFIFLITVLQLGQRRDWDQTVPGALCLACPFGPLDSWGENIKMYGFKNMESYMSNTLNQIPVDKTCSPMESHIARVITRSLSPKSRLAR